MAIEWGQWRGSGNAMRVGIDVDWASVSTGDSEAVATVRYYTQNNYSWSDDQSLRLGGAIDGTVGYHNGQGDNVVTLRAVRTFRRSYLSGSYNDSPGNVSFTAAVNGAYNGISPSYSRSEQIPPRPIAAPNPPTGASVARVSDQSQRVTWNNNSTDVRPWADVRVFRATLGGTFGLIATVSGGASGYTDATVPGRYYQYRIYSRNAAGTSALSGTGQTGVIYTSPVAPINVERTDLGASQRIDWENNNPLYHQFVTEVWAIKNGAAAVKLADVSSGGVTNDTPTNSTYTHDAGSTPAYTTSDRWQYYVEHRTSTGTALYGRSNEATTETPGITTPPLAPTNLSPSNTTIDPTRPQQFSWNHTPSPLTPGDVQVDATVRYRESGVDVWTVVPAIGVGGWLAPENTIVGDNKVFEWQVATRGADAIYGPFSASATFQTAVTPIAPDSIKVPVLMDLGSGQLEASSSLNEVSDYTSRVQSQLLGGGVRAVDPSFNISWSERFIAVCFGKSGNTFRRGYHDIINPYGWAITARNVTSGRATLTVNTATNGPLKMRVGETITVIGAGAPYDGQHVVRETGTPSSTTGTVVYDVVAANQSSGAAGDVYPRIPGHAGASDTVPLSVEVPLGPWESLWYEMPFGWGSGAIPRKNGVTAVTSSAIVSNKATLQIVGPHYHAVGDRVDITGVGASFDGEGIVLTAVGANSITYDKVLANQTGNNSGLVSPGGRDTFFGNFHIVAYSGPDFVVPSNWILLAVRNHAAAVVEWINGDVIEPGFDSDSPVFRQVVLSSVTDVTTGTNNKPPLRIGNPSAGHMRVDANEIQTMASNSSGATAGFLLNAGGGSVAIGEAGSGTVVTLNGVVNFADHSTTPNAPNAYISTAGRVFRQTSSRRYKGDIRDLEVDVEAILSLRPRRYRSLIEGFEDREFVGFIAEEADELGLGDWVTYDPDLGPDSFEYPQWVVALQAVCQNQQEQIAALTARLDALEQGSAT